MHDFRTGLRSALNTIQKYSITRARELELELSCLHRDLSNLQNNYLELSMQASSLAQQREATIKMLRKTQAYLKEQACEPVFAGFAGGVQAEPFRFHGATSWAAATGSQAAGWWTELLNGIRDFFTPYTRSLEDEIADIRRELDRLGDQYLELGVLANTLAEQRDAAIRELRDARARVPSEPEPGVEIKDTVPAEDSGGREAESAKTLLESKLERVRAEKNDFEIKLAESEQSIIGLRSEQEQLHGEIGDLAKKLADAQNLRGVDLAYVRSLSGELRAAQQERRRNEQRIAKLGCSLQELRRQLAKGGQTIAELKTSLSDAVERRDSADQRARELEQSLGRQQEDVRLLALQLQQLQGEKNDALIELADSAERIEGLNTQQAQLTDEIRSLRVQIGEAAIQHDADRQTIQTLGGELEAAQREQTARQRSIDGLEATLTAARERQQDSTVCIRELETRLAQQTEHLRAISQQLQRTQGENNDAKIRRAEDEELIGTLKAQQAALAAEINSLSEQLTLAEEQQLIDQQEKQSLSTQLEKASRETAEKRALSDELTQRSIDLTYKMAQAKQQIADLELLLAEANLQQEVTSKRVKRLEAQNDEETETYKQAIEKIRDRLVASEAENEKLKTQIAARHPLAWTRIAAGFIFLIGILASIGKIFNVDDSVIRLVGLNRSVESTAPAAPVSPPPVGGQAKTPGEQAAVQQLAALEPKQLQPSTKPSKAEKSPPQKTAKTASPLSQRARKNLRSLGVPRAQVRSPGGLHSKSWLMGNGETLASHRQACEERGNDREACRALENNLLAEGVIGLPGGVQYTVLRNGNGSSPDIDDGVVINYTGMLLDGQVFDSSSKQGGAVRFQMDEVIAGLQDVLQYMEEGAKWEVYIPGDMAFKKPAPYGGETLVFEIELLSVEKTGQSIAAQTPASPAAVPLAAFEGGTLEKRETETPAAGNLPDWRKFDPEQDFLTQNAGREGVVSLPSGLQYKVIKRGAEKGTTPRSGDKVLVHYRGMLLDGSEFDSSYADGEPVEFELGGVNPAWKEALVKMQEGDKWELYVPPSLAQSNRVRKRNLGRLGQRPLVYEIELIAVSRDGVTDSH